LREDIKMSVQAATAAFTTVATEVRDCELEIAETERHLSQIADKTRRAIAASRQPRSNAATFPFFIASATALALAILAITARRRR
jgi:hypothetical protein